MLHDLFHINQPAQLKARSARCKKEPLGAMLIRLQGRLFLWAILLTMLGGGLWFGAKAVYKELCQSDFFQITAINIEGCNHTSKKELLAQSGLDIHTNLLALQPAELKAVLGKNPWIEDVEITRSWPNKLFIAVREKTPAALINLKSGLFFLDRNGVTIGPANLPGDIDYPVLTGNFSPDRTAGNSRLKEALLFLQLTAKGGSSYLPNQNISEIHLTKDDELILFLLDRAFPIYLGKECSKKQHGRLVSVLRDLYRKNEFNTTNYINMHYKDDQVLIGRVSAIPQPQG
ncbi:MAG: hypothetical protein A2521_04020 [Deltaproteobacteria bacterium RIFOXYD12_FULL_57_12]|nr:MAG: hypothetical protein A2521_04020 [Deltaproteobacteria bacterium RIFOXYD12_FULL_57_12]